MLSINTTDIWLSAEHYELNASGDEYIASFDDGALSHSDSSDFAIIAISADRCEIILGFWQRVRGFANPVEMEDARMEYPFPDGLETLAERLEFLRNITGIRGLGDGSVCPSAEAKLF